MSAVTRHGYLALAPWPTRSSPDAAAGAPAIPLSAEKVGVPGAHGAGPALGGLRMSQGASTSGAFSHQPVMLEEVLDLFAPVPAGLVVDATLGGAGHAAALLDRFERLRLLGLDQDPGAVAAARARLERFGARATVERSRFDSLAGLVRREAGSPAVVGVLFDLGVSSPQLDQPERGFSYRMEGPLDMRMDPSRGRSAAELVNEVEEGELAALFAAHGEERLARRIARAVVAARPVTTTTQLAEAVAGAVPAALRRRGHPARRVFQALRVEVNEELAQLGPALEAALDLLAPGGRCVVLAYHSGEDRIVKERFRRAATGGCVCPPGLPCVCGAVPTVRLLTRGARKPKAAELASNPRAEAARLRAVERLAPAAPGTDRSAALARGSGR